MVLRDAARTFFAEKFAEEAGIIDISNVRNVASPYIHGGQGKNSCNF